MEKQAADLHGFISQLQDHLVALREAFSALTHTLVAQEMLDRDLLATEFESARHLLERNGEKTAASVLADVTQGLLEDLNLKAAVLQGQKSREAARRQLSETAQE